MRYEIVITIQYKQGMALCSENFDGEKQIKQARKFAGEHNTYNAFTQVVKIDENAAPYTRNRFVISESPFPFQRFGDWVIAYTPNEQRSS